MSNNLIPTFNVKRIKGFSFFVNESLAVIDKPVRIQFQHYTTYHSDKDIIDLTLRVYYSYDTNIPPESILVDFHVQNLFEVKDLKQYMVSETEYRLPQNFISSILGVAISHLRSLMAANIAGTAYQDNLIPIVNPREVAESFYPNMFSMEEGDKPIIAVDAELNPVAEKKVVKKAAKKAK